MTFSEWKILNFNIQFIFFKPAYFFSTLFAPQPHSKNTVNKTVKLQKPVKIL